MVSKVMHVGRNLDGIVGEWFTIWEYSAALFSVFIFTDVSGTVVIIICYWFI
jgi:hypothetical protein